MMRGVRGATTVEANDFRQMRDRVAELLTALVADNGIIIEDIGAVIFSSTPDLNAGYPAAAARMIGWADVPLFGTQEVDVAGGVPRCIRVLLLWNTDKSQKEIRHLYLHGAASLRLDIAPEQDK